MAEHSSRLWVPLQCLNRSESLSIMAEHTFRLWVLWVFEQIRTTDRNGWTYIQHVSPSSVSRSEPLTRKANHASSLWVTLHWDQNHWQEQLNIHPVCEFSPVFEQSKTTDKNGWTCIQFVSPSPLFKQFRTTDKKGWTLIQLVSYSPVFEQIWITNKNDWICIQLVSPSPVFEQIRTTERMAEHLSRKWVPLQCLSR